MSDTWIGSFRLDEAHPRLHRTPGDALACGHRKEDKHFRHLPDYPPLRKKRTPAPARTPAGRSRAASVHTVDDDEEIVVQHSSASPTPDRPAVEPSSSRGNTPDLASSPASSNHTANHHAYLTPITKHKGHSANEGDQQLQEEEEKEEEEEEDDVEDSQMDRLMRRRRAPQAEGSSGTATPTSYVPETPLLGLASGVALPGVVQSIETGYEMVDAPSQSGSVQVPASATDTGAREETPKTQEIGRLRTLLDTVTGAQNQLTTSHDKVVDELLQQTARGDRLYTRKEINAAHWRVEQEARYQDRQAAHEQIDALVAENVRLKAAGVLNARGLAGGAVMVWVLVVAYWAWMWANGADFEYIDQRRRAFFGLEKK